MQKFLAPLSTSVQWYHRSVSLSNVLGSDSVQQLKQYKDTIENQIEKLSSMVTQEIQIQNDQKQDEFLKNLSSFSVQMYQSFSKIISLSTPGASNQIVHQMALPVNELIMSANTSGNEDSALIGVLRDSHSNSLTKSVVHHLVLHIREKLFSLRALGFQTVYIIRSIDQESNQKLSHASTLQLLAITRRYGSIRDGILAFFYLLFRFSVVDTVEALLDQVVTFLHIRQHFSAERMPIRSRITSTQQKVNVS